MGRSIVRRLEWLKPVLTSGAASIAVGMMATNLVRIVSTMILTRLLDPAAYGVVGILLAIATTILMLSDIGVGPFIVRHKDGDDEAFRDAIWTLRLIRSVVLTVTMIAIAVPFTAILDKPFIAPVLMVWSISFLIDGLSSLSFATAVREQKLWRMSMVDLAATVLQLIVSTGLALLWPSYWVIPLAMVAGSILKAVLSYAVFPNSRRHWRYERTRAQELWEFARFIAPSSLLSLLLLQTDKLVMARVMTLSDFGHYSIAVTLSAVPVVLAHQYAFRVLYAGYSKAAHDGVEALRAIFYAKRRKVTLLYMFLMGGFIGGSPFVIRLLYDARYVEVAPILQILLISSAVSLLNWSSEQALMALGQLRATLMANVVRVAWLVVAGFTGYLTLGTWGLIYAMGGVEVAGLLSYWWNLSRNRLLNVGEEAIGFAALALGYAIAIPVNAVLVMLITKG